MRDIVKDAAIITVAQTIMSDNNGAWMSVKSFVQTYAKKSEQEEMYNTLSLFELAYSKPERDMWGMLTNEREWVWNVSDED